MKIEVAWFGADSSRWQLLGQKPRMDAVSLRKPGGMVAIPKDSTRLRSHGVGVARGARVYEQLEGQLDVVVSGHPLRGTVADAYRAFVASLSTLKDGRLEVTDSVGVTWNLSCRLKQPLAEPEWSSTGKARHVDVTVPFVSDDGVWQSHPIQHRDGRAPVSIHNPGDLPLHPDVVWTGSGQSVTLPNGRTVQLPAVNGWRRLSTNPGKGFQVTTLDGDPDSKVWSQFRGLAVPGRINPGETTVWKFTSRVHLDVSYQAESPWR